MQESFDAGRRALKQRGGLFATLTPLMKGMRMPDRKLQASDGAFTVAMEHSTQWMHDTRRLIMIACVSPFLAFFCDATSIRLLAYHQVRQVAPEATYQPKYQSGGTVDVYFHETHKCTMRFQHAVEKPVVDAIRRDFTAAQAEALLHQAGCVSLPSSRECSGCSRVTFRPSSLKKCSACFAVFYCNQACQKAHWKDHKKTCKRFC